MIKIYTCESIILINHFKNIFKNNQIDCVIKNENIQSISGEVPPIVTWPELWIYDEFQLDKAQSLIANITHQINNPAAEWQCEQCGELNEGQFKICWNCN